jgi:hypothetical protein
MTAFRIEINVPDDIAQGDAEEMVAFQNHIHYQIRYYNETNDIERYWDDKFYVTGKWQELSDCNMPLDSNEKTVLYMNGVKK